MPHINLLLIFLIFDVFVMGFLAAVAVRHGREHFRRQVGKPAAPKFQPDIPEKLPPELKQHMIEESETDFESTLNRSVKKLEHDLADTSEQINNLIKKLATDVVSSEIDHYRDELVRLREQAKEDLGGIKQQMEAQKDELRAQAAQELETEKQQMVKNIDTRLADAVTSFLTEALQHNIDLGGQADYLLSVLDEHKAEFVKEVGVETEPQQ